MIETGEESGEEAIGAGLLRSSSKLISLGLFDGVDGVDGVERVVVGLGDCPLSGGGVLVEDEYEDGDGVEGVVGVDGVECFFGVSVINMKSNLMSSTNCIHVLISFVSHFLSSFYYRLLITCICLSAKTKFLSQHMVIT